MSHGDQVLNHYQCLVEIQELFLKSRSYFLKREWFYFKTFQSCGWNYPLGACYRFLMACRSAIVTQISLVKSTTWQSCWYSRLKQLKRLLSVWIPLRAGAYKWLRATQLQENRRTNLVAATFYKTVKVYCSHWQEKEFSSGIFCFF